MRKTIVVFILFAGFFSSNTLKAQQPMMGEIRMFAGTYAPKGWAFCEGQLLPINEYQALYSVIGTTYGGNGVQTFALPNLKARVPIHPGNGQEGNRRYSLGQAGGWESVTLTNANLPAHNHTVPVVPLDAGKIQTMTTGTKSLVSTGNSSTSNYSSSVAGSNQPVPNMQPYLVINYIISLTGEYPQRQ